MNKSKSQLEAVDLHRLARLSAGDPVARYGQFVGLTFISHENGYVTLRDRHGNEKRVYESLFLKHGFLEPNSKMAE